MSEADAGKILRGLLKDVPRLSASRDALGRRWFAPGSAAATDSKRPLGRLVAHQSLAALGVGFDHIEAWSRLFIGGGPHPTFAHITLVRGAIEGAVRCLWIVDPAASPTERIARTAGAHLSDLIEHEKTERAIALEAALEGREARPPGKGQPAVKRLAEFKEQLRLHSVKEERRTMTELFKLYGPGESTYRMLSAVAHGKDWAIVLARHHGITLDPTVHVVRLQVSADPAWSVDMTAEAVRLLRRALAEVEAYFGEVSD